MKEFYELITRAYRTRDRHLIPQLLSFFHEDCIVIGTSLGEVSRGKKALENLIRDDFRYWVDISFQKIESLSAFEGYEVFRLEADALYCFHESEKTYQRYLRAVGRIKDSHQPAYYKAIKTMWMLDHLLASKPKKIRRYQKKLKVSLLVKEQKIHVIEFSFPFDPNHVDAIEGLEEDMDMQYGKDVASLKKDSVLSLDVQKRLFPDGHPLCEAHAERIGSVFFGYGKVLIESPMEDELMHDFDIIDQPLTSYQKLYQVRKKLGETLRIYAKEKAPKIMVRFWGVVNEDRVIYSQYSYPFYFILED